MASPLSSLLRLLLLLLPIIFIPSWALYRTLSPANLLILTYALRSPVNDVDYLTRPEIMAAFQRAFDAWAKMIPVQFKESPEFSDADIQLTFYPGVNYFDNCVDNCFVEDPEDYILGYAVFSGYGPIRYPYTGKIDGEIYFNALLRWAVDLKKDDSEDAYDLETVAIHEIGHILGFGHSEDEESVMYRSLSARTTKRELRPLDVEEAVKMYGHESGGDLYYLTAALKMVARIGISSLFISSYWVIACLFIIALLIILLLE